MTSKDRFVAGLALGVAGGVLFGEGALIAIVLVLGAAPLALGPDGPVFVAGLLSGFGATWLALMTIQAGTGGAVADPAGWIALGGGALLLGLAIVAVRLRSSARRRARQR